MSSAAKGHNIITCTKCRTNIDTEITGGDVKFCPNCGNPLFTPSYQTKTHSCPSCGKTMSAPFDFCPGCGTRLSGSGATAEQSSPEDYPPTAAEMAAARKPFIPTSQGQSGEPKPVVTDPKLKKLYKQWAAYSDLPEEALPVMEKPKPVKAPQHHSSTGAGVSLSGILAEIPPRFLFVGGIIIIALILILIIVIVA